MAQDARGRTPGPQPRGIRGADRARDGGGILRRGLSGAGHTDSPSLLVAWIVRGNKLAALFPQVLHLLTWELLPFIEFKIGARLWPVQAHGARYGIPKLNALLDGWHWSAPAASLAQLFSKLGRLGVHFLGPLALGFLVTGLIAAAISYLATLVAVWTWRARRRSLRLLRESRRRQAPPLKLPDAVEPAPGAAEAVARYARTPAQFRRAEAVKLLVDGTEAYPEMLAEVEGARSTVDLETYMIRADATGARFQEALVRAAGRGVKTRLLYDYIGSLGLPDRFIRTLLRAGVAVSVYHPLVLTRPSWALNRRDHRKNLIVDRRTAFTGGLNIADEYALPAEAGGWRDTHVRLDGVEPAAEVTGLFEYGWNLAMPYGETGAAARQLASGVRRRLSRPIGVKGARRAAGTERAEVYESGGVAVRVIGNREFERRYDIRRTYLYAMRNARRYILIENAYFIPDRRVRRALARAAARGVVVALAIAHNSDVTLAAYASRNLYSELLGSGVRLFEWPFGMLHAKTAVIDDAWAIVGSYNFDHRSLLHQLEAVAVVTDPGFARRLRDQTMADLAKCREVTLVEHESRSWRTMLLESAAYSVRHWL